MLGEPIPVLFGKFRQLARVHVLMEAYCFSDEGRQYKDAPMIVTPAPAAMDAGHVVALGPKGGLNACSGGRLFAEARASPL